MRIVEARKEVRRLCEGWRTDALRVGLVPTMGNLHAGHLRLVEVLRPRVDRLVASLFVNPLQFAAGEDYSTYPRTWDADRAALEAAGVDAVFAPSSDEMYPGGSPRTQVLVPGLSDALCGACRPGHFEGVGLVVTKLFQLTRPNEAAFGMKDYQQLQIVRTIVQDLDMPVEVVPVPTVRESDGLALSSRNRYLTAEERRVAPLLHETLQAMARAVREGAGTRAELEQDAVERLEAAGFGPVDYVALRRRADLQPPAPDAPPEPGQGLVCLGAAHLGRARLIDNVPVD